VEAIVGACVETKSDGTNSGACVATDGSNSMKLGVSPSGMVGDTSKGLGVIVGKTGKRAGIIVEVTGKRLGIIVGVTGKRLGIVVGVTGKGIGIIVGVTGKGIGVVVGESFDFAAFLIVRPSILGKCDFA